MYKTYPKIHRLGKDETEDYLLQKVIVQEKIDGANISIFLLDGKVRCGTRTRMLPEDESFNGFQEAVKANPAIENWLLQNEDHILYGEWLVKHTITYPDEAYKKIYLFDIYAKTEDRFYSQSSVKEVAKELGLEYPQLFVDKPRFVTVAELKEFVGKSFIAANGEGVVIKSLDYRNRFGDHCYAKMVHEKFKESNAIVFGGNNKHSEAYWEMYIVNKYATLGRVQKIMQKLQSVTEKHLDMEHTAQVAGSCYHDMVTEEAWAIFKKAPVIDTKRLQRLSMRKFIQLYHDILNNSLSVADANSN